MSAPDPTSEVSNLPPLSSVMEQMAVFSSRMETIFQKIVENLTTSQTAQASLPKLINFDPDEPEADIVNWCALCELIITKRNLEGVDLILALTHSLKGRSAMCLTKIQTDKISWPAIKEILISKFSKPMMMQDYFDQIIKFRIDVKESPAEAGMRLWELIEKIPDCNMPEKVITGFAISILSQCDDKICRELNSVVINDKNQLFRTLRRFNLERRFEDPTSTGSKAKRFRITPFRGNCNFCGRLGHRARECRDKIRFVSKSSPIPAKSDLQRLSVADSQPAVSCYVCGDPGHVVSGCPLRYKKKEDGTPDAASTSSKQVNVCARTPHGVSQISGIQSPFLFDSGSECSLIKQSCTKSLKGERFHEQVSLKGLGVS